MSGALDKVYADGTPADGVPFPADEVPTEEWLGVLQTKPADRRKVHHNPPAALIHKQEEGAPWRRAGEAEVDADLRKARVEIERKRVVGLARQSCSGLNRVYGASVDYTSFSAQLDDALKLKARFKASGAGGEVPPDVAEAVQLIDAVLRFDLPKLAAVLHVKVVDKTDAVLTAGGV